MVELLVEPLDGRLAEDTLAPGLALGTAQDDAPVPRSFLNPVQRIGQLAGAVEADVQGLGRAGLRRGRSPQTIAIDDLDLLAARQLHAMTDMRVSLGLHGLLPNVIDFRAGRL